MVYWIGNGSDFLQDSLRKSEIELIFTRFFQDLSPKNLKIRNPLLTKVFKHFYSNVGIIDRTVLPFSE